MRTRACGTQRVDRGGNATSRKNASGWKVGKEITQLVGSRKERGQSGGDKKDEEDLIDNQPLIMQNPTPIEQDEDMVIWLRMGQRITLLNW